jgi:hypothetical protein
MCRWRGTYRWKAFDEVYNFALDVISIGGLHTKLWAPKVVGVLTLRISGLPGQNAIWMLVPWPSTKYTIKRKVVASPKSRSWWVLWVRIYLWLFLAPKVLQLCINQLVVWFVQVCVSDWLLVILPSFIPKLQHAPLPPKCCEPKNVPQLLFLLLSSPLDSQLSPSRSLGVR